MNKNCSFFIKNNFKIQYGVIHIAINKNFAIIYNIFKLRGIMGRLPKLLSREGNYLICSNLQREKQINSKIIY